MKIHNNKYTKIVKCPACGQNYKIDTEYAVDEIKEKMYKFRCFDCMIRSKPFKYEIEVRNLNDQYSMAYNSRQQPYSRLG